MDPNNPIVKLCIAGTQAEFHGQIAEARALYQQAWEAAQNDLEACIAAHYMARHQDDPAETLRWNQMALDKADASADPQVKKFYPSLFLNLGHSFELLDKPEEARRYYDLAAQLGVVHQAD